MKGRNLWPMALLAVTVLAVGCSGVLMEKPHEDGSVSRVRIEGGESWSSYDTTPRYRSQKAKDQDDMCIMLKNEATF